MPRRLLLLLMPALVLLAPLSFAAEFDPAPVARDVETAFRAMMEARDRIFALPAWAMARNVT